MKLLLDLGNSRCKFAVVRKGVPDVFGAMPYHEHTRLAVIENVLRQHGKPDMVVACSVLGTGLNERLEQLLASHRIDDYFFLKSAGIDCGIRPGYQNPDELGADRLAAMVAASAKYQGNTCIVDCGTAITVDVLATGGIHHGGVIFPGFMSMQAALASSTDLEFRLDAASFAIAADSTRDAIYSGCQHAVAGGIEHAVCMMQDHYGLFDQIILTGGDAALLAPLLTCQTVHEPHLVLDGLKHVSEKVRVGRKATSEN